MCHFLTINENEIFAINKTLEIINEIWHSYMVKYYKTKTLINILKCYIANIKSLKKSKSTKYYKHQEKCEVLLNISICKCVDLNAYHARENIECRQLNDYFYSISVTNERC